MKEGLYKTLYVHFSLKLLFEKKCHELYEMHKGGTQTTLDFY